MARFGRALTRRRTWLGLSKRQLAERAEISGPYVGELEAGNGSRPGIEVLARLADALKTTPDELLADFGLPIAAPGKSAISSLYSDLDDQRRRTFLRIGQVLREEQEGYGAEPKEEVAPGEEPLDVAAYDRPELAEEVMRESEDFGQDDT